MLPHIQRQERLHAIIRHWRVAIVKRCDVQLAVLEDQPSPSAGEMADGLRLELRQEVIDRTIAFIDHFKQLASRGLLFRAEAKPIEAVRSEEHTSELQSLMRISYAVFCLTKKKDTNK